MSDYLHGHEELLAAMLGRGVRQEWVMGRGSSRIPIYTSNQAKRVQAAAGADRTGQGAAAATGSWELRCGSPRSNGRPGL